MMIWETAWLVPFAGLLIGMIIGYAARNNHFCTLNALERLWYAGDSSGVRSWVLAAAIALLCTVIAQMFGVVDLSDSFYLSEPVPVAGAIVGGFMFGVGMALVGTCGFGAIVRLGGGNLRSLVVLAGIGLAAIAAARGVTAHLDRWLIEPFALDLTWLGAAAPGTPFVVSQGMSLVGGFGLFLAIFTIGWCLKPADFRKDFGKIKVGVIIGVGVVAGWLVTGTASVTSFEPFQIEAGSFVAPVGDTILQLITVTGAMPDYGVGLVVGVFVGAAFAAWRADDLRWEACDDARELGRHLLGAFLMGTGGVMALGCTIGQGVSAVSMMAASVPLAMGSMVLGARVGLSLLVEGSAFAFLRSTDGSARHPAE